MKNTVDLCELLIAGSLNSVNLLEIGFNRSVVLVFDCGFVLLINRLNLALCRIDIGPNLADLLIVCF